MRITEEEQLKLILKSNRERRVHLSFGPSYVGLQDTPDNDWARELIKKWRSEEEQSNER